MMETEEIPEMMAFSSTLPRLIAREDFSTLFAVRASDHTLFKYVGHILIPVLMLLRFEHKCLLF
jgi:hypothetical protein